jgi:hypothetical protein
MGAGIFLPEFLERFNEKFSVRAVRPDNLHRRLTVSPDRLSDMPPRTVDPGLRSPSNSSWIAVRSPRILAASMSISMTSRMGAWRCAGRHRCFPTGSSTRISA